MTKGRLKSADADADLSTRTGAAVLDVLVT